MTHRHRFGIALTILGIVTAGLIVAAQEKDKPAPGTVNAKVRLEAVKNLYDVSWQTHMQWPEGPVRHDPDYWHDWSVRWMQAERDLGRTNAERIAALEGHLKRMKVLKERLDEDIKKGSHTPGYEASAAEVFRLEAEDWLSAAKADEK